MMPESRGAPRLTDCLHWQIPANHLNIMCNCSITAHVRDHSVFAYETPGATRSPRDAVCQSGFNLQPRSNMFAKRGISVVCALSAALLIAGCASGSSAPAAGKNASGGPTIEQRLAGDFPIPSGVAIDEGKSLVLGGGGAWTGRIVFSTSSSPNEAFLFYRDQPKSAGWSLVASLFSKSSVLTYTKGNRSATIQIEGSTFGSTTVSITVGALSN